jgi:hypothetical protein
MSLDREWTFCNTSFLAKALTVLLLIGVLTSVVVIWEDCRGIKELQPNSSNGEKSIASLDSDGVLRSLSKIADPLRKVSQGLVPGIVFLVWLYLANRNAWFMGATLRHRPWKAVLYFCIPIFCLFKVYGILSEIWNGSHAHTQDSLASPSHDRERSPWIAAWSAVFIPLFLLNIGHHWLLDFSQTVSQVQIYLSLNAIAQLMSVPLALLTIRVVRVISQAQWECYHLAQPVVPPTPESPVVDQTS